MFREERSTVGSDSSSQGPILPPGVGSRYSVPRSPNERRSPSRVRACGDLVFVSSEGCQDFGFLAFGNLEEVEGASELRSDLIEFRRSYPEVPVSLLKAERRLAGLSSRKLEGPIRNVADPQRPHELEAG